MFNTVTDTAMTTLNTGENHQIYFAANFNTIFSIKACHSSSELRQIDSKKSLDDRD